MTDEENVDTPKQVEEENINIPRQVTGNYVEGTNEENSQSARVDRPVTDEVSQAIHDYARNEVGPPPNIQGGYVAHDGLFRVPDLYTETEFINYFLANYGVKLTFEYLYK